MGLMSEIVFVIRVCATALTLSEPAKFFRGKLFYLASQLKTKVNSNPETFKNIKIARGTFLITAREVPVTHAGSEKSGSDLAKVGKWALIYY